MVCIVRESALADSSPFFDPVLPFNLECSFMPSETRGSQLPREKNTAGFFQFATEKNLNVGKKCFWRGKFPKIFRWKMRSIKKIFDSWSKQNPHTHVNLRSLTFYFGRWLLAERGALVRKYVYVYRECPSVGGGSARGGFMDKMRWE